MRQWTVRWRRERRLASFEPSVTASDAVPAVGGPRDRDLSRFFELVEEEGSARDLARDRVGDRCRDRLPPAAIVLGTRGNFPATAEAARTPRSPKAHRYGRFAGQ